MTTTNSNNELRFSLRKIGEINPLDIQCMAFTSEFGEIIDYDLEDSGTGLAEYRTNSLINAVHCMLTGGNGTAMSPNHHYRNELEIITWSIHKTTRVIKKVNIDESLLNEIKDKISGMNVDVYGLGSMYGEQISESKIEDRTFPLTD